MLIGGAIMEGTYYYRKKTLSINVKEKAFSELNNFTTYWKAKIAAGEWQIDEDKNWRNGPEVELFSSIINSESENQESIKGNLFYKAEKIIKENNYDYYFYRLETKIKWQIKNSAKTELLSNDSLKFLVDQIVFVK